MKVQNTAHAHSPDLFDEEVRAWFSVCCRTKTLLENVVAAETEVMGGSGQSKNAVSHSKRKPTTSAGFLGRKRKALVSSVVGDVNIRSPSVIEGT